MKRRTYLNASQAQRQLFFKEFRDSHELVLLNLLKFKTLAEYDDAKMEIESNVSGKEAYDLYRNAIMPELDRIGSRVIFQGDCSAFLIGPDWERWDVAVLVKHKSVHKFIEFSKSKVYLENVIHRTAALEDSRLLPIVE